MPPALPGGLIAPGARFTIRGVRLGTAGQTAVNVQWDSHQARAQLLSVSSNEIEGILPLTVPSGEAMITVASAILTSRPFPIRVADSAPGLYSANRRGWGPAAGTHSAVPGRRVTLLATGLGHGRSAKLEIGGRVVAHILSAGPKAGQPGIEEIAFMLPGDVPEGCYVPVVAATPSGVVSNVVTLSIARPGHMCLTPKDWPQPSLNSVPVTAILMLSRFSMLIEARPGDPQVSEQDNAAGLFLSGPPGAPILPIHLQPPAGTCAAMAGEYHPGDSFARLLGLSQDAPAGRGLNAGEITILGPPGSRVITAWTPGFYSQPLSGARVKGSAQPYFVPGEYRITGGGTESVGAFSLRLTAAAPLVWRNRGSLGEIVRARGATVAWSGAARDQPVLVIAAGVDRASTAAFACWCVANPSTGQFTLTPAMLANFPATEPGLPLAFLALAQAATLAAIEATGIDRGMGLFLAGSARTVRYR